jgi:hypothetical protein
MRRGILAGTLALLVAACAGDGRSGRAASPIPTCSPAPTIAPPSGLPPGFPTPGGVAYTSEEQAGPSRIVSGYWIGTTLEEAFEAYKDAFADAGYQITDEEIEAADAEVNFAGGDTTGQVRLDSDRCARTVTFDVTIRPA